MPNQSNVGEKGIVTKASPYPSVSETLQRLWRMVREKSLEEFALIDHSGAVERVGLEMQEAKLLIFGSPRAGTPLMVASLLLALDLPLKILVWRKRDDEVLVSYNATSYLAATISPRTSSGTSRASTRSFTALSGRLETSWRGVLIMGERP
jgi:uncharacterized protein (DUF302 family)